MTSKISYGVYRKIEFIRGTKVSIRMTGFLHPTKARKFASEQAELLDKAMTWGLHKKDNLQQIDMTGRDLLTSVGFVSVDHVVEKETTNTDADLHLLSREDDE